jgi:tetratricopeptide (TPR) repeat protein
MVSIVGNIGAGLLGNLIADIAKGEDVIDEDIRHRAEDAIHRSDIANLLTKQDFLQGYARLIQRLDAQKTISQDILDELRTGFSKVASADQVEELKRLILQLMQKPPLTAARKVRLFISYARADDEPFVERLYNDLKHEFDVWWDRVSMPNRGLTFLNEIRDAVEASDRLILILGPHAVTSGYVEAEWKYALSVCVPVLPLLRKPLTEENGKPYDGIPPVLSNFHIPDCRTHRAESECFAEIRRILQEVSAPLGDLHGVPALPNVTISRTDILQKLQAAVMQDVYQPMIQTTAFSQTVALHGLGGTGKSVMAAAFARGCDTRRVFRDGVVWITVGRKPNLRTLYEQLGLSLGDVSQNYIDPTVAKQRAQVLLARRVCLVVLDDVWDGEIVDAFKDIIEQTRCRLLITTRSHQISSTSASTHLNVTPMSDEQAQDFLQRSTGKYTVDYHAIVTRLGGLPIALHIAAAQLRRGLTPNEWLERFTHISDIRMSSHATRREDSLAASIELSLNAVFDDDSSTRGLYYALGIFREDTAVPKTLALRLWDTLLPDHAGKKALDLFDELQDWALIDYDSEAKTFSWHDTLLDYAREHLNGQTASHHSAFLDSYAAQGIAWAQIDDDGYIFRHLGYHMLAAGRVDQFVDMLVESPAWLDAKQRIMGHDVGYLRDIELALSVLPTGELSLHQWGQMAQLFMARQVALIRSQHYTNEYLPVLVRLGNLTPALEQVRSRPQLTEQIGGLRIIYDTLYQMGTPRDSLLDEMLIRVADISDAFIRYQSLNEIVLMLNEHQHPKTASLRQSVLALADLCPEISHKLRIWRAIAWQYRLAGDTDYARNLIEQALSALDDISDGERRQSERGHLVNLLGLLGDARALTLFQQALEDLPQPTTKTDLENTLSNITTWELAQIGIDYLHTLDDIALRESGWEVMARSLAYNGHFDHALSLVKNLKTAARQATLMGAIATYAFKQGETERGLHLLNTILAQPWLRLGYSVDAYWYVDLIQSLLDHDQQEMALRLCRLLKTPYLSTSLGRIAVHFYHKDPSQAAQLWAEAYTFSAKVPATQETTLRELALLAAKVGDISRAQQYLDEALVLFRNKANTLVYQRALRNFIWWAIQLGETASARALIEQLSVPLPYVQLSLSYLFDKRYTSKYLNQVAVGDDSLTRTVASLTLKSKWFRYLMLGKPQLIQLPILLPHNLPAPTPAASMEIITREAPAGWQQGFLMMDTALRYRASGQPEHSQTMIQHALAGGFASEQVNWMVYQAMLMAAVDGDWLDAEQYMQQIPKTMRYEIGVYYAQQGKLSQALRLLQDANMDELIGHLVLLDVYRAEKEAGKAAKTIAAVIAIAAWTSPAWANTLHILQNQSPTAEVVATNDAATSVEVLAGTQPPYLPLATLMETSPTDPMTLMRNYLHIHAYDLPGLQERLGEAAAAAVSTDTLETSLEADARLILLGILDNGGRFTNTNIRDIFALHHILMKRQELAKNFREAAEARGLSRPLSVIAYSLQGSEYEEVALTLTHISNLAARDALIEMLGAPDVRIAERRSQWFGFGFIVGLGLMGVSLVLGLLVWLVSIAGNGLGLWMTDGTLAQHVTFISLVILSALYAIFLWYEFAFTKEVESGIHTVTTQIAHHLALSNMPELHPTWQNALSHPNPKVRRIAKQALATIDDKGIES